MGIERSQGPRNLNDKDLFFLKKIFQNMKCKKPLQIKQYSSIRNITYILDQVYCAWLKKELLCLYILKKPRFGRVTPMPDSQTTEYSATQLVESIKFKLSHAISWGYQSTDRNRLISLSSALNVIHTQITKGSVNIQIPLKIIELSKNLSAHFLCFISIILFLSVVWSFICF